MDVLIFAACFGLLALGTYLQLRGFDPSGPKRKHAMMGLAAAAVLGVVCIALLIASLVIRAIV